MKYGAITEKDAEVFDMLFAAIPKRTVKVLEIGVWKGDTARGMKSACEFNGNACEYTGIDAQRHADPDPPFPGARYIVKPSEEAWEDVRDQLFDLIFVDGCHCLNHVSLDTALYSQFVAPGGYMVFHDASPLLQGVQKNPWVHGHDDLPVHRTHVLKALELLGWPNAKWRLVTHQFDPASDIGGMIVFQRT